MSSSCEGRLPLIEDALLSLVKGALRGDHRSYGEGWSITFVLRGSLPTVFMLLLFYFFKKVVFTLYCIIFYLN
jgi:hypothetical protein